LQAPIVSPELDDPQAIAQRLGSAILYCTWLLESYRDLTPIVK
jgi:hypothetical protein